MSTPTSSTFLPRRCMIPYGQGKFVLSGIGPSLELIELDSFYMDTPVEEERRYKKTRVFLKNDIRHILPLCNTKGDVVAISTEPWEGLRALVGCVVRMKTILSGGYVNPECIHTLCATRIDHPAETRAEAIPDTNEIVLLTGYQISHFGYRIDDKGGFDLYLVREIDLSAIIPRQMSRHGAFFPSFVVGSADLEFVVINKAAPPLPTSEYCLVHAKWNKKQWICREHNGDEPAVTCAVIGELDAIIVTGSRTVSLLSTNAKSTSTKMKILDQYNAAYCSPKAIEVSRFGNTPRAYIIDDDGISTWDILKRDLKLISMIDYGQTTVEEHAVTLDRSHLESMTKLLHRGLVESLNNTTKNDYDNVIASSIVTLITHDLRSGALVVAYESGRLNAFDMNEFIFPASIGSKRVGTLKQFSGAHPLWNPALPIAGFALLVGISNGKPAVLIPPKLCNIFNATTVRFDRVTSSTASDGISLSVYYNKTTIMMLIYEAGKGEPFQSEQQILPVQITDVFVSEKVVMVVSDDTILTMDMTRTFSTEGFAEHEGSHIKRQDYFDKDEGITAFHVQKISKESKQLWTIGTTNGKLVYITFSLNDIRKKNGKEMKILEDEGIVGIKQNRDTGMVMVLGSKGRMLQIPDEGFLGAKDSSLWRMFKPSPREFVGFLTIYDTQHGSHMDMTVSKNKGRLHLHYLESSESVFDTADADLGKVDSNLFAHFVFARSSRRICFYTISTPLGGPPKLVCIEGALKARNSVFALRPASTLAQIPSTVGAAAQMKMPHHLFMVPHKESGEKNRTNVISTRGSQIEWLELNGKGQLDCLVKEEIPKEKSPENLSKHQNDRITGEMERLQSKFRSLKEQVTGRKVQHEENVSVQRNRIICADVAYDRQKDAAYVMFGMSNGEVGIEILKMGEPAKYVYVNDYRPGTVQNVCFFKNSSAEIDSRTVLVSVVTDEFVHTHIVRGTKIGDFHSLDHHNSTNQSNVNNVIAIGEGKNIHDIWILGEDRAIVYIGRELNWKKHPVVLNMSDWNDPVVASCYLSNIHDSSASYLDLVFVAKSKGRIGVLVALQLEGNPADSIQFAPWPIKTSSSVSGLHAELVWIKELSDSGHTLMIRLFVLKKSSLQVFLGKLVVDEQGLRIEKTVRVNKISTAISNPHSFAVSEIKKISECSETPPKYALIFGSNGSEVLQICQKKEILHEDFF